MKRLILTAFVMILLFGGIAEARTVHQMLNRQNRANAAYDMSVIPELLKSNANVFFVDNEATNASDQVGNHGDRPEYPFSTYDYAVGQCTAGENNIIVILPYSQENVTADSVDVDVTGITTIGLGHGPARPKFISTAADSSFNVGSTGDGATFMNITFEAGISEVAVGIEIEDLANNITFIDCEWLDASTSTYEFDKAVDVVTDVNDLTFVRCKWTSVAAAGATACIHIDAGAVEGLSIIDCDMYGDYDVACVFSDQALTEVVVAGCNFYNANAGEYAIEAQGTANLGIVRECTSVTDSVHFDAGGLSLAGNLTATAGDSNTDQNSDGEDEIIADIAALTGTGFRGVCTVNTDDNTIVSAELLGFGNDYFNTGWEVVIIYDASGAGSAPEGEIVDVNDYVSSTGTFSVTPDPSAAITTGDLVYVRRVEDLGLNDAAILGSSGTVYYLDDGGATDAGGSSVGDGRSWTQAFATLTEAEAAMSAGDTLYVGASHNENIATGGDTINLAGVSIIGMGEGDMRPLFDFDAAADEITLDAAGIILKNLRFRPGATDVVTAVRVEDAGIGCVIENCAFVDGEAADEEFRIAIDVDQAASNLIVRNCTARNLNATAGDQDSFVDLSETTIDNATIEGCDVYGDYAIAPIWGDAAIPVNILIKDNVLGNTNSGDFAIEFTGAATGSIIGNKLYSDAYATMLDPGSAICIGNTGTDAINESGIPMPLSATSDDIGEDDDGANLERLEYLQNKVDDILAGIRMAGGSVGDVYYCDDGGSAGAATTWATAVTTLDAAWNLTSANVGDIIFVAPAHDEALAAAQITFDTAGVTVIGIGDGDQQPEIEMQATGSSIDVTAAGVTIKNLKIYSTTAVTTIAIDVDAGDFTIEDCLFQDVGDFEFTGTIDLGATAENATIRNCRFESVTGTTGATGAINITGGVIDRLIIEDCHIWGDFDNGGIYSDQINTNAVIRNNSITNNETGDHAIELSAAMTGDLVYNLLFSDTYGVGLDPGSMKCFGNKHAWTTDMSAMDVPLQAGKQYTLSAATASVIATTSTLFTIAGGPIKITDFFGVVTTEIGASNMLIQSVGTIGPTTFPFTTSVACDSDIVGTTYTFTGAIPSVLTPLVGAHNRSATDDIQWYAPVGTVDQLGDGAVAGVIVWYMTFIPLADNVVVTDAT